MKKHRYNYSSCLLLVAIILLFSCGNDKQKEQTEVITWDTTAAFLIDSAVEMDEVYIPDFRQEDSAFHLTAFIIQPGVYSSYYITKEMTDAEWYTMTKGDTQCHIEEASVNFDKEVGDYEDTMWNVSGAAESVIHLSGINNIKTGAIESIILDNNVVAAGENRYFDFGDTHYRLYASGYTSGDKTITKNYRLVLEAQKGGTTQKQIIFAHSYFAHYRSCIVEFVGDIDNDGQLDMIIRDAEPDGSTIMLYLSGAATEGELLHLSGFHRSFVEVGC